MSDNRKTLPDRLMVHAAILREGRFVNALHRQAMHDRADDIADAADEIHRLRRALRRAARNDGTVYDHHQPRRFDGKKPSEQGGTIWLTPREIARDALDERDLATAGDTDG